MESAEGYVVFQIESAVLAFWHMSTSGRASGEIWADASRFGRRGGEGLICLMMSLVENAKPGSPPRRRHGTNKKLALKKSTSEQLSFFIGNNHRSESLRKSP